LTHSPTHPQEEQGLGRPAAFFVGAKLFHKRWWKRKPVFCMLVEMMPKALYSRTSVGVQKENSIPAAAQTHKHARGHKHARATSV
jgi:hypothetical protein